MLNRLSLTVLALLIAISTVFIADSYAQKPIQGQVVSLNDIVMGGKGKITKDEALKLAENGSPIVFKSGKKIYFVYNDDGTFAGKRLAKYASNEKVGIVGKTKKVNGIDIIIASMIDSM
jgi:hypothetical protein